MLPEKGLKSGIVFFSWLYLLLFIPSVTLCPDRIQNSRASKIRFNVLFKGIFQAVKRLEFFKLITCIGIPSGILEEGVILFSFPLFLAHYKISSTQIGQWLVLFSIGFFVTNRWVAKRADKLGTEKYFLSFGLIGLAVTLLLLSLFGKSQGLSSYDYETILIGALFLLGIFRVFLLSPAVAQVSKSPIAISSGKNVALSVYRLFETSGRIIGPLLLGQLLLSLHYSYSVFLILALLYFIAAVIFITARVNGGNNAHDLEANRVD